MVGSLAKALAKMAVKTGLKPGPRPSRGWIGSRSALPEMDPTEMVRNSGRMSSTVRGTFEDSNPFKLWYPRAAKHNPENPFKKQPYVVGAQNQTTAPIPRVDTTTWGSDDPIRMTGYAPWGRGLPHTGADENMRWKWLELGHPWRGPQHSDYYRPGWDSSFGYDEYMDALRAEMNRRHMLTLGAAAGLGAGSTALGIWNLNRQEQ